MTTAPSLLHPNMPARNPWLTDSVFPIVHFNPGATDAVPHAGPTIGRNLSHDDVPTIPTLYTSNGAIKRCGDATVVLASGADGIRKIDVTGDAFDLISVLAYPGLEALLEQATPELLASLLAETDAAAGARDEAALLALSPRMAEAGFTREHLANGVYNFIDKDGFHYAAFGKARLLKSTDDNDPRAPLRVVKEADLAALAPPELASEITLVNGLGLTYDGDVAAAASGALFLLDRDLELRGILPFPGEAVENGICMDESGIYVVTSRRMLKVVWTGSRLSIDEADGGWSSEYNTMSREQATAAGSLTQSGGSGTTPTLMGFGDDPDKLVIIADGDPTGTNVVAFWRNEIPDDFQQKPGTKSRRIADQIRTDISRVTIEASANVLGTGVLVINGSYPDPVADLFGDAMTSGVTRPAPTGAQKFTWNTATRSFSKAWTTHDIDNTDQVVPVVSTATGLIYFASKREGNYEYVALDWDTGGEEARWPFPDGSRVWNVYAGGNVLLANGDFSLGGLFALKRARTGKR